MSIYDVAGFSEQKQVEMLLRECGCQPLRFYGSEMPLYRYCRASGKQKH